MFFRKCRSTESCHGKTTHRFLQHVCLEIKGTVPTICVALFSRVFSQVPEKAVLRRMTDYVFDVRSAAFLKEGVSYESTSMFCLIILRFSVILGAGHALRSDFGPSTDIENQALRVAERHERAWVANQSAVELRHLAQEKETLALRLEQSAKEAAQRHQDAEA